MSISQNKKITILQSRKVKKEQFYIDVLLQHILFLFSYDNSTKRFTCANRTPNT